jgi:hypothetical protein
VLETEREKGSIGRVGHRIKNANGSNAKYMYIREEGRYRNTPELKAFLDSISRAGVM